MGITQSYLCDCCGVELTEIGVTHATTMMYVGDDGSVCSAYFGSLCNCGPNLIAAAQAQRTTEHAVMKNVVPKLRDAVTAKAASPLVFVPTPTSVMSPPTPDALPVVTPALPPAPEPVKSVAPTK